MKVLVLLHPDLVPPESATKKSADRIKDPWITEFDVIQRLKGSGHSIKILGVQDSLIEVRKAIENFKPTIVFNLLEEFRGEAIFDQNIVSYLELLGVAYTGCNPKGLMLSRDKALSKKLLSYHRIRTPKFQVFPRNQPKRKVRLKDFPLIVKCLNEEASMGISQSSIVNSEKDLSERIEYIHSRFGVDAIVEEFIEGREYFVGVLGNYRLRAFHPRQLVFKNSDRPEKEIYSENAKFSSKYRNRKGVDTEKAKIDGETLEKLMKLAKKTYRVLGLSGYARVDFRVDSEGNCYVLEANPNPDIAEFDEFAEGALSEGLKYKDLLNKILKLGKQWSPEKGPMNPIAE